MKMKNLIEKIILILLLVAVLLYAFNLRKSDSNNQKTEKMIVMSEVVNLSGKKIDDIRAILGKEKTIHKDKVYTYEDSIAKYDLLIVDDIESAVVTLKENKSKEEIYEMLSIKADMYNDKVLKHEDHYKIIDELNNIEVSVIANKQGEVTSVKIRYN